MHEDADSQKRQKARRAGDAILEAASYGRAKKRTGRLYFLYGGLFSQREIETLDANPAALRNAVQYARRRWEVSAAVFALLCLAGSGLYFFSEESVVWMLPAVLAGVLLIRRLMRRFVLEHLEQESG